MTRSPRTFSVVWCYDCGWVGNRPDIEKNYQGGEPSDLMVCPECAEATGSWFTVVEVMQG